jgi:hypothetical protein
MHMTNANTIRFKSQSVRLFEELFASYNYSMRHFMGELTGEVSDRLVQEKAGNVMTAVYAYLPDLPFVP